MKADRDDAPTYARQSARRSNRTTWIVASFMGSAVTVGLLYTLSSLYMQGKVDRLANTPKPKPAPIAEITRSAPAEKDWDKIVEDVARRSRESERIQNGTQTELKKQTEFNSATYLPAHAVNSIPNTRSYAQPKSTPQRKQQEIVIIGKAAPKLSDYCPYSEGSIQRRNCKTNINLSTRNNGR
ncbi:hypothetical protein [Phytopseudomonas punonensis]|uniref:Uncharacterized protein n=1 Tax=Phytopseudomonas punonensis TaxID=1220495 RepID=A0A1M7NRQ2_9GAMM|nr:hypothetical protein [Pseudomonas punonensis]SHN06653.1 hypothetical protein SAMN05216288_0449 [Pseudomonas punonensis]